MVGTVPSSKIVVSIFLAICFAMKFFFPDGYLFMIKEDGPLENIQAMLYFGCFLGCLFLWIIPLSYMREPAKIVYAFLSLIFFFLAAEEISWGQRIFSFSTPEFFLSYNIQREISVHNLLPLQNLLCLAYVAVSLVGFFAGDISRLFYSRTDTRTKLILYNHSTRYYFLPCLILYGYIEYLHIPLSLYFNDIRFQMHESDNILLWRDQEPTETMLAFGFTVIIFMHLIRSLRESNQKTIAFNSILADLSLRCKSKS